LKNEYQKVVVFDFNGTIEFHGDIDFQRGMQYLSKNLDIDIEVLADLYEQFQETVVINLDDMCAVSFHDELHYFVNKLNITIDEEKIYEMEYSFFKAVRQPSIPNRIRIELISLLRYLKTWGFSCHILSNTFYSKDCVSRFLEENDLDSYFEVIITAGDTHLKKPNKALFNIMMNELSVDHLHNAFFIGDTYKTDALGSSQLGMVPLILNFNIDDHSTYRCYRDIELHFRKSFLIMSGISSSFSTVDGPHSRIVLFTQGCTHFCEGCHNQDTWDLKNGSLMAVEDVVSEAKRLATNERITISGGEPLIQYDAIMTLIESLSGFDICLYTGFEMDEVPNELVEKLTYIKVGKFVKSLQTSTKPYVGSSNQKFIKLKELEK